MRTTLDLDPTVLSAARAKANADRTSIGRAVSELALAGLQASVSVTPNTGFPTLPRVAGHVITDELVAEHRDD